MARKPRKDFPGAVHHVGSRGVARTTLFKDDQDRRVFLALLEAACREHDLDRLLYCLLGDHFHLLVRSRSGKLSLALRSLKGNYARYFNARYDRDGALFKGPFWSKVIGTERYLHSAVRYIVWNPVEAGLCAFPGEWYWSTPRPRLAGEGSLFELLGGEHVYDTLVALGPPAMQRRRDLKRILNADTRDEGIRRAADAGFAIHEIAAGLGISRTTVWRSLRRAT